MDPTSLDYAKPASRDQRAWRKKVVAGVLIAVLVPAVLFALLYLAIAIGAFTP